MKKTNGKWLWALFAAVVLIFTACPEAGLGGEGSAADTTELENRIGAAQTLLDSVVVSETGTEIPPEMNWISGYRYNTLNTMIKAAEGLIGKSTTTKDDVDQMLVLLNSAINTVEKNKKPGTSVINTGPLISKIHDAKDVLSAAPSIIADATVDAPQTARWTPTAVANALDAAIKNQEAILLTLTHPSQEGQVTAGVQALTDALVAFTKGIKTGPGNVRLVTAGMGASHSSVNGIAFRQSSMSIYKDPNTGEEKQFIVYFKRRGNNDGPGQSTGSDNDAYIEFGERLLHEPTFKKIHTTIRRPVNDAHDSISMIVDGLGYIHMAVNHHNKALQYYRGPQPGVPPTTESHKRTMVGSDESSVTYVEFYKMNGTGNLLFAYRQGGSGSGYMVLNKYTISKTTGTGTWSRIHQKLLDGTVKTSNNSTYSPYWQMYMDDRNVIHLSWTFRESSNVDTNAHKYYTYSKDEGQTWLRSNGTAFTLPIGPPDTTVTAQQAEKVWDIPQKRNLMNQTNMTGEGGNPYILTYFSTLSGSVLSPIQYRVIYRSGTEWKITQVSYRTYQDQSGSTPFLTGSGTMTSPLSRPRMVVRRVGGTLNTATDRMEGGRVEAFFICRFQNSAYSSGTMADRKVAMFSTSDIEAPESSSKWKLTYLTDFSVNAWEPSMDTDLWKEQGKLHVFVQFCRGSSDGVADNGTVPDNNTTYPEQQVYNLIVDTSNP